MVQHVLLCFCRSASGCRGFTGLKFHPSAKPSVGLVWSGHGDLAVPSPSVLTLLPRQLPVLGWADPLQNPVAISNWPSGPSSEYLSAIWGFSGSQICQMSHVFFHTDTNHAEALWLLVLPLAFSYLGVHGTTLAPVLWEMFSLGFGVH